MRLKNKFLKQADTVRKPNKHVRCRLSPHVAAHWFRPRGFPMDVWPDASRAAHTLASGFPFFPQMADAMEMMILSILAPQLHCEWRLPSWQVALLTSVGSPAVHRFPWCPVGALPISCCQGSAEKSQAVLERKGFILRIVPLQSALLGEVSAGTQGGAWRQELK